MSDISRDGSGATTGVPAPVLGKKFTVGSILLEGRAFFALIAIIAVFSILSENYFTLSNFLIMTSQVAIFGLLAVGMLVVILSGGIDLSVGSTLALCGVFAGFRGEVTGRDGVSFYVAVEGKAESDGGEQVFSRIGLDIPL